MPSAQGGAENMDWAYGPTESEEAASRGDFSAFPDPKKHIPATIHDIEKLHDIARTYVPDDDIEEHRYWIAVFPPCSNLSSKLSLERLAWFKGNRLSAIWSVHKRYAECATLDPDSIKLVLGCSYPVGDNDKIEELDFCNDHIVALRCVEKDKYAQLVRPWYREQARIMKSVIAANPEEPIVIDDE